MDILPAHLREIAHNPIQRKKSLCFDLKCTCGNETFKIMKGKTHEGKQFEEEWNNYWKKYRFVPILELVGTTERKSGRAYCYGKTFFGIRVGKLYFEDLHCVKDLCVVKAVCPNCSKEFVLFDNRKHGYDALSDILDAQKLGVNGVPFADEKNLKFRNSCKGKEGTITVAIQNYLPLDDFYETFGENASDETYSIAFSWINIIATVDNKDHTILDMETQ